MTACSHVVNIGGILNRERQEQKAQVSIKCRTGDDALSVWLMITVCLLSPLMESATSDAAFLGLRFSPFADRCYVICRCYLLINTQCFVVVAKLRRKSETAKDFFDYFFGTAHHDGAGLGRRCQRRVISACRDSEDDEPPTLTTMRPGSRAQCCEGSSQ